MYVKLIAQTNYRSITNVHASVYDWCSHFVTLHLPQFFSASSTPLLAHVHIYMSLKYKTSQGGKAMLTQLRII